MREDGEGGYGDEVVPYDAEVRRQAQFGHVRMSLGLSSQGKSREDDRNVGSAAVYEAGGYSSQRGHIHKAQVVLRRMDAV